MNMLNSASNTNIITSLMSSTKNVTVTLCMVALVIFLGNGLNLIGWGYIVQLRYYLLMAGVCWALYGLFFIQYRNRHITFKYYSLFLTLWPFGILLTSSLLGGIITEELTRVQVWVYVSTFFMLFYHFKFTEKRLMWIIVIVAIITAIIQILQQVDPLFAIFGGSADDTGEVVITAERNGMARFFVGSYQVQMLAMCFCWYKMLKTFKPIWFLLSALMLVSIYLYLTKQILITTLFTLALSFFLVKGRWVRILSYSLLIICGISLAIFWEDLFGDMIRDSKDDNFSHAIRFEFIGYIIEYNFANPVKAIFGHGTTIPFFEELRHMLYHPSDIGFFGESIYYGWPWALAYFYIAFRILVTYRAHVPIYIRLYVLCSGFISIFIFPYRDRIEMYNWMCVVYIASLYIDKAQVQKGDGTEIKNLGITTNQDKA